MDEPIAVEAFLNLAPELNITRELTDEEIIEIINYTEAEDEGTGRSTEDFRENDSMPHESKLGEIVLSTSETSNSIQSLIHKLLIDTDIPEAGLKQMEPLES